MKFIRKKIQLCNGVWCNCPEIEIIRKEDMEFVIVYDDFKNHTIFTVEEFFLKNYLHFERVNAKISTLSDIYGNKLILTKNDVTLIQEFINGGYKNAIK